MLSWGRRARKDPQLSAALPTAASPLRWSPCPLQHLAQQDPGESALLSHKAVCPCVGDRASDLYYCILFHVNASNELSRAMVCWGYLSSNLKYFHPNLSINLCAGIYCLIQVQNI